MKPRPSPIKDKIYATLKVAPQTVAMIAASTGLTKKQIHATLYASRIFQTNGDKDGRAVYWSVRPEAKPFKFSPIMGYKRQIKLQNAAISASEEIQAQRKPADTFGHFEVRHVNANGFLVCEPVHSLNYANMLAAECGGRVVVV